MMKKISATLLMLLSCLGLYAQGNITADSLYASGKIYVVVVCVVLILLGLIFFLFSMDRRLKKLERNA
ncbi:CcmD family protein [Pedobacter sp. JY14-1]|uniref:CcmD family protein n=1 Tax=Pedobacter sp. JY14-1 TaxID=3034151 RepID=UPI0023E325BD|nr:CcmD family protein [Pedobacter sp. JY14-1]